VSPLRPWEWARLAGEEARAWVKALELHAAYAEGVRAARSSAAGYRRLDTAEVGEAG
jgi:hypothetical protein